MPTIRLDEKAQNLLKNYVWNGNIRQLKNITEQLSVLEKNRSIDFNLLSTYLPEPRSNLPALIQDNESGKGDFSSEREILYKILFDIYHQQIQEGNLIPNIEKCWDEIGYFQIGDNPGRNEPTTGEINYKNIFKYIHSRGFDGIMGMEHGNSRPDKVGEIAVINACLLYTSPSPRD